ncbi:MAG: 2-keto-4-pentenoate hydratase [Bdellovibrionaceae bacterium]|nr:2-keto-4-pentenoate hydratase [Pseudobdellovibrionaceae bacterium]|tara:strand:+ start:73807 stop:74784 length:978 start_codon:yes stop_codon:yes gene_type:complete
MKLGSLKSSALDGELVVVSKDNKKAVKATRIAPNLREALENWGDCEGKLKELYEQLNQGLAAESFDVDQTEFHSPMPRTFQWADGSAFIHHVKLVRMARNAPLPETLETVPLMYQGGSDSFLAPTEDIPQRDFEHGTDFEGEVGVVTGDVPMGVSPEEALKHIRLFVVINDVSLRGLIPAELKQGFGFLQSKPSSAFAPFAVTEDELFDAYKEGRIHLPLSVEYNGEFFGKANAKEMHFHFGELIAHAAKTRRLTAGTIIGSGTVSNEDMSVGSSCLAEKRMLEKIHEGEFKTPFMKVGDTIKIEMLGPKGDNIFGTIEQRVVQA